LKTSTKYLILILVFSCSIAAQVLGQDANQKTVTESVSNDSILVLEEIDKSVTIKSLKKGRITVGIAGQLKTDEDKNYDDISQYIIDWNDRNLFLKLTSSYFIKDRKSLGIFIRHGRQNLDYTYVTVIGDTISNETKERSWRGGFYYKLHSPVFGSKRVYWISIAELGIGHTTRNDKTILPYQENISETDNLNMGIVARFGFLVFPFKGFSIEGSIAALGFGYDMQNFYYNEDPNGSSNDFVVLFTPDILSIQFRITTYF